MSLSLRRALPSAPPFSDRTKRRIVLLVALAQGLIFLFLLPPWQFNDEPTHFEYTWWIANHSRLPTYGDVDYTMRRDVAASMLAHDFYESLSQPDLLTDSGEIWIGVSQFGHPPAYYVLVSLPLRLVHNLDVTTQLYVARFVSLLLLLATAWIAIRLTADLTPPGHTLRWAMPLAIVLLPTFAHTMTAVNNDAGAIAITSFFLWGAVRTVRHGITLKRSLWVIGAAILALFTKNTALVAGILLPVVLLAGLWQRQRWRWQWLVAGIVAATIIAIPLCIEWGSTAAYWYPQHWADTSVTDTRMRTEQARSGGHAISIRGAPENPGRRLLSPLDRAAVRSIAGETVTYGGWMWATEPVTTSMPVLSVSHSDERSLTTVAPSTRTRSVTETPGFFAAQVRIPDDAQRIHYTLLSAPSTTVFLDDAFIIAGSHPTMTIPTFHDEALRRGTWAGTQVENLVRNPSAEVAGPYIRPWVANFLSRLIHRIPISLSQILPALYDISHTGPFVAGTVVPFLADWILARFAWGHVHLPGDYWATLFGLFALLSLIGTARWLIYERRRAVLPALALLTAAGLIVWLAALIRPLPLLAASPRLPAARYLYPAIIPMMFSLVAGWTMVWPRSYRTWAAFILIVALLALDCTAILTIWFFYYGTPLL